MNRVLLILVALVVFSCGGSLTDEQRKQMKEARDKQAIVKVTEAEIAEAAFAKGRSVTAELTTPASADKVEKTTGVKIHWLEPGAHALQIEQQLIDAYINSVIEGGSLQDNVQEVGNDSLLYTKPIVVTNPDSSIVVKGTWNVWISKKQLVLSMNKK